MVTATDLTSAIAQFEQTNLGGLQPHIEQSATILLRQSGAVVDKEIAEVKTTSVPTKMSSLRMTKCSLRRASADLRAQLQKRSKHMWMVTGMANQIKPWFELMPLKTLRRTASRMQSR
eukprot:2251730-Karenia_brevis.AAC.1